MSAANPAEPVQAAIRPHHFIVLLSLLLGIQPVTTDLYLASLPSLGPALGASMVQVQLTFSVLLIAFCLSQLFLGPISDRVGRRPVVLWGLGLYTVAAWLSVFSANITWLIALRGAQGVAMGAVVMSARAIVRDLYAPQEGARVMSKGLSGLGLFALMSPIVGGLLASWGGWSYALMALGSFGAVAAWAMWAHLPETLPDQRRVHQGPWLSLTQWARIVRNRSFQAYALQSTCAYGLLFTYLATSPFVFMQKLGLDGLGYGSLLAASSSSYLCGTFFCRWLLRRLSLTRVAAIGGGITLTGVALALILAHGWPAHWLTLAGPILVMLFAHGIHQPIGQSASVGPFPHEAGTASALNGFAMMLAAFVMGQWLGHRLDGTVFPLVHGMAFWGGALALTSWTWVQRHGRI